VRTPIRRLLSLLLATTVGLGLTGAAAAAAVDGPDVSGWQHPNGYTIDWSATRVGGAEFAFVKATEGTGYTNPYFAKDFAALAANKMVRGAYHFARPAAGTASAVAQARHFISVTGTLGTPGDLPPVLDLEVTGGLGSADLIAWAKAFLAEAERLTGRVPVVYTSPGFWKASMANSAAFTAHPLWIATWGPKPVLAGGWTTYAFWQYTDKATVPGMPGPVDMSVFNGTLDQLRSMAKLPSVAPPTPTPSPEPQPTVPVKITVTPTAATVAAGATSRLTATITRADTGAVLAGAPVTLRVRPRAGAVPAPVSAKTDGLGNVTVTVRPAVTTDVTVTAGTPAVVARATVTVTPKLDVRLSATRVKAGTNVIFTGTTGRELAGATVYRQSYYGGAWHNRGTAKVDARGTVRFTVKPLAKATSKYRLKLSPGTTHGVAASTSVTLRVV
jgi:GH25 family lysozyme M1 (1,4-beta-N-acetylmuramidase)